MCLELETWVHTVPSFKTFESSVLEGVCSLSKEEEGRHGTDHCESSFCYKLIFVVTK